MRAANRMGEVVDNCCHLVLASPLCEIRAAHLTAGCSDLVFVHFQNSIRLSVAMLDLMTPLTCDWLTGEPCETATKERVFRVFALASAFSGLLPTVFGSAMEGGI